MRKSKVLLMALALPAIIVGLAAESRQPVAAETTVGGADWSGGNTACAVVAIDDVRCFATVADMERATSPRILEAGSTRSESTSASAASYCHGRSDLWLYLYEFSSYGGRVLKFRDVGYWQNLSTWGFNDQMTSWRNDTYCAVYAAEGNSGAGSWLTLAARSSSSYVGSTWDNRVSSIYITG